MHQFKELKVWQQSVDLVIEVYDLTKGFPGEERYGLTSQLQRSMVSIPANIAEGAGRNTNGEFRQFLGIALGSTYEVETHLEISKRLGFVKEENFKNSIAKLHTIQKMINRLIQTLS